MVAMGQAKILTNVELTTGISLLIDLVERRYSQKIDLIFQMTIGWRSVAYHNQLNGRRPSFFQSFLSVEIFHV